MMEYSKATGRVVLYEDDGVTEKDSFGGKTEAKMFEDAKVGNKVVRAVREDGKLVKVWFGKIGRILDFKEEYPIEVLFNNNGRGGAFTLDGRLFTGEEVELYPANSLITITPPKPKEEIEVEGWINLYPTEEFLEWRSHAPAGLYRTKELADTGADMSLRLGEAVHIKHKYKE